MLHKKLGMDKDYLATKAIPFLFPLAVEPGLNLSQVKQTVQYPLIKKCLSHDVVTSLTYEMKFRYAYWSFFSED